MIAAIMIETVTGSGGVLVNPPEVLQGIQALCHKYNLLLIMDEVMTGIGRCGEFFAFQRYPGIVPDIFTSAKAFGAGFLPQGCVGFQEDIHKFLRKNPMGWGNTF